MKKPHLFYKIIFLYLIFSNHSSCHAQQSQESSQPRLLLNPGPSSSWDLYNTDNDFLLHDSIQFSPAPTRPVTIVTSTSLSSSSSSSSSRVQQNDDKQSGTISTNMEQFVPSKRPKSKNNMEKLLEGLEQDMIKMVDSEHAKLESFINQKIREFDVKMDYYANISSVLPEKLGELQIQLENVIKTQQDLTTINSNNNANEISDRMDSPLDDFDSDQTKAAVEFAEWLDKSIGEYDTYKIFTPILKQIQGFRNSKKQVTLDSRMERRSSESECGGIVISDSGEILYNPEEIIDSDPSLSPTSCIWTLRVTQRQQIAFTLDEDNFPSGRDTYVAIHSLTTTPQYYFGFISFKDAGQPGIKGPIILRHNDKSETVVDGPLVFITLVSPSTRNIPSFKLSFKSVGIQIKPDLTTPLKYNHFHYTDLDGTIDYPSSTKSLFFGKGKWYRGPEIASFTILPKSNFPNERISSTKIYVDDISIRESLFWGGCDQDSLTFFAPTNNSRVKKYLPSFGKNAQKKGLDRYCGEYKQGDEITSQSGDAIIAVFKTDLIMGGGGFQFSWESV